MTTTIQFQKSDIEKILEVLNKFPDPVDALNYNYKLNYTSTGIGYCLDLILEIEVNGIKGSFIVPIAGVEDW